jgi:cell division septation protein DedD
VTLRPLPRSRLEHLIPSLVASQALVVLVPMTGDLAWAAGAAWDVARAATRGGRRVALVDLRLEAPLLHQAAGVEPAEGVVDAFEFDVSLTKATREIDGVFFMPAGSPTADPNAVLAQPRWRRLQAGFRHEDALLLLFLSDAALPRLAAVPDGIVVLAPEGFDLDAAGAEGIRSAVGRGATLLGTVRERWTGAARASGPLARPARRPTGGLRRPALVVGGCTVVAAAGWALLARSAEPRRPAPGAHSTSATFATQPAVPETAGPPHHPAAAPADTEAWTVQLAAYGTLEKALAHADRLAAAHIGAFVTPIALDAKGSVWYRVLAGAYVTRDSAAAGRTALWRRGLAPRGEGDLLRAPYSFSLPGDASTPGGDLARLRARGIAAVRSGGTRILVGAFETPEQATLVAAQLERAGIHATLVTRTGTTP